MSKLIFVLLLATLSATLGNEELEAFARKVIELLNPHGANGKQNSILLSLTNGEQLYSTNLVGNPAEKLQVNITFEGAIKVSALKRNNLVQVEHQFNGGAIIDEADSQDGDAPFPKDRSDLLEKIYQKNNLAHRNLNSNTTGVIVANYGGTAVNVTSNQRKNSVKVLAGFVVGSTTKVDNKTITTN